MIEARNITKTFDGLEVLKGVDLNIGAREIVGVVGPSGAGKTTLLQILGTLMTPDGGSLTYDGVSPLGLSGSKLAEFRNRTIGFVFQFHQLLPEFSLIENGALPALIGGVSRSEAFKSARKLTDYMGLSHREDHKPAQLSGGERQRAAVARALVRNPKVVLADEPSGSLDSQNRAELHKLFFELRRDLGQTFVIVTHDDTLAESADRIVRMADGRIV